MAYPPTACRGMDVGDCIFCSGSSVPFFQREILYRPYCTVLYKHGICTAYARLHPTPGTALCLRHTAVYLSPSPRPPSSLLPASPAPHTCIRSRTNPRTRTVRTPPTPLSQGTSLPQSMIATAPPPPTAPPPLLYTGQRKAHFGPSYTRGLFLALSRLGTRLP